MSNVGVSLKDRITNVLTKCTNLLSEHDCASLFECINSSLRRLAQPMQLAIIGKISSSKSTLVNAILGESEVVRTGQMEETFNVSWLKFGDSNSDIKVIFKNGEVSKVPRAEWSKWTSHQEKNVLKEQVKYIEVFYNHEILKSINIIDTPGLDALSQIDSQNTIAFLKEVHPDAVIMLFTKSIAETTLSVLQDFQSTGTNEFNLSALNAIGVLAKVDTIWSSMEPEKDAISVGKKIIQSTLLDKYPEVRKSLFSILPISSLMGLSSSTINSEDLQSLRVLSSVEESTLLEMLSSPDFFTDDDYQIGIERNERKRLHDKFGLYGIYVLVDSIRRNQDASINSLSKLLVDKSGFGHLLFTIQSHFGKRATLIKSQGFLQEILSEIYLAKRCTTGETYNAIAGVENLIVSTLLSLHEYKEWEFLSKYYEGELALPEDLISEFLALSGEKGYSASERLGFCGDFSLYQLEEKATERALYWQKQYNIYSVIEPEISAFYKTLISSYNILLMDIRNAKSEYENAKRTLNRASIFLGFNHNLS